MSCKLKDGSKDSVYQPDVVTNGKSRGMERRIDAVSQRAEGVHNRRALFGGMLTLQLRDLAEDFDRAVR